MKMLRFRIGRWLILAGLRTLPPGRVRSELDSMMRQWSAVVMRGIGR